MNLTLFLTLNAGPYPNPSVVAATLIFNKYIPYLLMLSSALALVFCENRVRATMTTALVCASAAAVISWFIGYHAYMPRPFVESIGHAWLEHRDNASFPSNHMMFMAVFATAFLQDGHRRIGFMLLVLALVMGWARIYLGVHYPVDIAGGAVIGMVVTLCLGRILCPAINSFYRL